MVTLLGGRVLSLCGLLCMQPMAACTADAELYRVAQGRGTGSSASSSNGAAAGAGAGADSRANSPQVLITPAAAGPIVDEGANGCVPGHYVGSFRGIYNSAAWGNGSVPLMIEAVSSLGAPGLEFWLESTAINCEGAEFCPDFTVKGGKIRGFANPFPNQGDQGMADFMLAIRFEIDLTGDLDCTRGQFRGTLENGCYDVATVLFRFEGSAPAVYDRDNLSFTDGQWSVKELPMSGSVIPPDPTIGGMGTWEASLINDSATRPKDDTSAGLCKQD